MNELPEVKAFPTIRAQIGDWFYYVTTLPFYEVANRIRPATEFFHPPSLNEWIQREVMPSRRKEIAEYLLTQPERFFNGIVVGVYWATRSGTTSKCKQTTFSALLGLMSASNKLWGFSGSTEMNNFMRSTGNIALPVLRKHSLNSLRRAERTSTSDWPTKISR